MKVILFAIWCVCFFVVVFMSEGMVFLNEIPMPRSLWIRIPVLYILIYTLNPKDKK